LLFLLILLSSYALSFSLYELMNQWSYKSILYGKQIYKNNCKLIFCVTLLSTVANMERCEHFLLCLTNLK
jgi:hypothetical protein